MALEHLADLSDERLADYHHLREPSRRMGIERDRGIFTVEGRLSVEALLASPYTCRSVPVIAEQADRLSGHVPQDGPVHALPARAIEAVTGGHFTPGVLAVARAPDLA